MSTPPLQPIADQLLASLRQESQLVDLIIKGCIEYRWAMTEEERSIAEAMVYNAFETYAMNSGMTQQQAEFFCNQYLDTLIQIVQSTL
jgi:hypothetical protein